MDMVSGASELESLAASGRRFVPDRGFAGVDPSRRLDGPVQFEKDLNVDEEDPFQLSKFLSAAKKAQKRSSDNNAPSSSTSIADANRDTTHRKRERRE
ncbi:unnamed protein product [Protopolystoma xenopodis]|uniref:Uncharacterized protein n=1 Tax=Protopolystoma xenopodis TaxID=117903 RepID=A0A448WI34_9PLAT|nr:unnamed protein product [Protopolystoma xenopodis]